MTKDDAPPAAGAGGVVEPGHRAGRRGLERTSPTDRRASPIDKAETRQEAKGLGRGVERGIGRERAVTALRAAREELRRPGPREEGVDIGGAAAQDVGRPAGREAGVDDEAPVGLDEERAVREPVEKGVPVGRREEGGEGLVRLGGGRDTGKAAEGVEIVVAEDGIRRCAEAHEAPEDTDGIRSAVHEITRDDDAVRARIEADPVEKPIEGVEVPLEVADCVGRHGRSVHMERGAGDRKRHGPRPESGRARGDGVRSRGFPPAGGPHARKPARTPKLSAVA